MKRDRLTEINGKVTRLVVSGVGSVSIDDEGYLSDVVTDVDFSNGTLRVKCGSSSVMNLGGMVMNFNSGGGGSQIVCGNMAFQSSGSQWTVRNMSTNKTMSFDSSFNNITVNGQRLGNTAVVTAQEPNTPSKTFRITDACISYIDLSGDADFSNIPAKFFG